MYKCFILSNGFQLLGVFLFEVRFLGRRSQLKGEGLRNRIQGMGRFNSKQMVVSVQGKVLDTLVECLVSFD